jgi:hypothetical protein
LRYPAIGGPKREFVGNIDKRRNIKMAVKVSRSSTGYDNDANIVIAGKSL